MAVAASVAKRIAVDDPPKPLKGDDTVFRCKTCAACDGRGFFFIDPFYAGHGLNMGGPDNMTQCLECKRAWEHWELHGKLPDDFESKP